MELPPIHFSRWVRWDDRHELENIDQPGVYMLAHFQRDPGATDVLDKAIIYYGETCDNDLRGRWRQFNRVAFQNKFGHSGGKTYRDIYGDAGQNLYVAAMPMGDIDDPVRSLIIRYVERKLILDFALKYNMPPQLNKK